jgi:hypothetical protein
MHVDLSFSYLRSAATASFDKKEFHRNCTLLMKIFTDGVLFYTCISVYAEFVTLTEVRAWMKDFWKREDIVENFSCTACKKNLRSHPVSS